MTTHSLGPDLSINPYGERGDRLEQQLTLDGVLDSTVSLDAVPAGQRAVVYLRVSSPSQVKTDYDPEGQSIPSQRAAVQRKAEQLGLTIIDEYIEPGRSATEMTKRIAFRQMLARIHSEKDVDHVIVYKMSRMARNRYEEALVGVDLRRRGVKLLSATENIDETPVGQLMQGMLAVFNEYQSAESGADIAYKMGEKAKRGGTLGRARLGYLNVIDHYDGREIRTIAIDQERAPFVKLAFELYATGEYTLNDIVDELTDRGLTTRPTAKTPAGPVSINKVHQMLKDRYYVGVITYKGEEFRGRHETFVDEDLFEKVQQIIHSRGHAAERRREHNHYLKGSVFCGECYRKYGTNRRLIIQRAVGRNGEEYFYFFCPGGRDGSCSQRHHNLFRVEEAVEQHYKTRHFHQEFIVAMRELMADTVGNQDDAQQLLQQQLTRQLNALDVKEENLLDLAADGAVAQGKIKARLQRIQRERERLEGQVGSVTVNLEDGARYVEANLRLLENPYELYMQGSDEVRRRLNQAIYKALYIEDEDISGNDINEPLDELLATEVAYRAAKAGLANEEIVRQYTDAFAENHGTKNKAALTGDLVSQQRAIATSAYLFTDLSMAGVSNKPSMVEMGGIEPPSTAVIPRLLRV